ncbi:hypothetical protein [Streptomyces virginiae]|uniref:hypothetical protein n=1 Tax=Streptomyces virginiae TaxID=1961 RepID=UPI00345DBDB2
MSSTARRCNSSSSFTGSRSARDRAATVFAEGAGSPGCMASHTVVRPSPDRA